MKLICKITDKDLGLKCIKNDNPKTRLGSRGIVIRDDGKIAIFYKSKINQYKLPGGGIDENEAPEDAFKREVLEETGCIVEIIKKLGTAEEHKTQSNFMQISYVFLGKVIEDTKQLHVTEMEKDEGAKLLWETPSQALKFITDCFDKLKASEYESVYATKFMVLRDKKILEYYIENML